MNIKIGNCAKNIGTSFFYYKKQKKGYLKATYNLRDTQILKARLLNEIVLIALSANFNRHA